MPFTKDCKREMRHFRLSVKAERVKKTGKIQIISLKTQEAQSERNNVKMGPESHFSGYYTGIYPGQDAITTDVRST